MYRLILAGLLAVLAPCGAVASDWGPAQTAALDVAVKGILDKSDVPSASVVIVQHGRIVLSKAYGLRSVSPATPTDPKARYRIGSVSKQFTAAAVLMLADEGKLSLDDKVGKWLPELTGAEEITLRQLLSHTSGYKSYFMIDYLTPENLMPVKPQAIAERWGRRPLDFEPGSSWRYGNTDYVIAGLIVEKVTGETLDGFVRRRIFEPLGMHSAASLWDGPLPAGDARGYTRFGLGPLRLAQRAGPGWEFAAGQWAMTAEDLAKWDISLMHRSLMSPAAYKEMETPAEPLDGAKPHYGLGVYVTEDAGGERVWHNGLDYGYSTENFVYPQGGSAIVVMVNADFADTQDGIAGAARRLLFSLPEPADGRAAAVPLPAAMPAAPEGVAGETDAARRLFDQLAGGRLDRTQLTAEAKAYFTDVAVSDYRKSLSALGTPTDFIHVDGHMTDGFHVSMYQLRWAGRAMMASLWLTPEGKVEEFVVFDPF